MVKWWETSSDWESADKKSRRCCSNSALLLLRLHNLISILHWWFWSFFWKYLMSSKISALRHCTVNNWFCSISILPVPSSTQYQKYFQYPVSPSIRSTSSTQVSELSNGHWSADRGKKTWVSTPSLPLCARLWKDYSDCISRKWFNDRNPGILNDCNQQFGEKSLKNLDGQEKTWTTIRHLTV